MMMQARREMVTPINWRNGKVAIREGTLFASGQAIPLEDIVSVSERRTTRRTRGSDGAFLVMLAAVLTGIPVSAVVPIAGGILLGVTAVAWFLAWSLRARMWTISLRRVSPNQTSIQFNQAQQARDFLTALTMAKGGHLQITDSPQSRQPGRRPGRRRTVRPIAIAIFFLGGAVIYHGGTVTRSAPAQIEAQSAGATIMAISTIVFMIEWLVSSVARRASTPWPKDVCRNCGYLLIGNTSGTCPECGRKISTL